MRTHLSILILIMFFMASTHPTTAQDDLTETFGAPDCLLSLDYPVGWSIFGYGPMAIITNNIDSLNPIEILSINGESSIESGQIAITILALSIADLGMDTKRIGDLTAMDVAHDFMDNSSMVAVQQPISLTLGGNRNAVQFKIIRGNAEHFYIVYFLNDESVVIIDAITVIGEMEQYEDIIIGMAETITYEGVALTTGVVEFNSPPTIVESNHVIWQQQRDYVLFRPEEFGSLGTIAIGSDDTIYVLDSMHDNIKVISPDGTFLGTIINTQLSTAVQDMALAEDGTFWLTDDYNRAIFQMDTEGNILFTIDVGEPGEGPGQFAPDSPDSIAIGPDGNLYIFDGQGEYSTNYYGIGRIQVFDTEGNYLREFPTTPPNSISHNDEVFIDIDSEGNIYAADSHEIIVFDNMGNVLRQHSLYFAFNQIFIYEIIVGPDDYLYVADAPGTIHKLNSDGNILMSFGEPLDSHRDPFEPGEFRDIRGLGVLSDGSIVATSYNLDYSQVVRFSFDNQDN
jgi:streptogramin lyase